jgi:hypothetical protein
MAFPIAARSKQRNEPVTTELYPDQSSDESHGEPMTKAEREELDELKELVHQQIALAALNAKAQPHIQVQTAAPAMAPTTKWLLASLAVFSFLGGAGSFAANSGIWVGRREEQSGRTIEQVKKLEDQIEYLKTWNEKLRNNMAAYGWLIDSSGDVSRIEQKSEKRR